MIEAPPVAPPVANTVPTSSTLFGDTRQDPYAWLRDRENPDTPAYLEAENAYTKAAMQPAEALQKTLYDEMLSRIQQTDLSVPTRRGDYFYYVRTEEGKEYTIYCRKRGSLDAPEEILLDCNELAKGHDYFRIGNFAVSPDDSLLAYSVDIVGDETYTIRIKSLATGELLADEIPNTYYSLEWAADNRHFFYCVLDEAKRPYKIFRHELGVATDVLVHHEADERFTVEIWKTSSREFLLLHIHSSLTSEVQYLHATVPTGTFSPILARAHEVEYDVTHHGDYFYVRTNDQAKTFRVMRTPVKNPGRDTWTEFIPVRPGITIEHLHAFRDYLVIDERDRGLTEIAIHHFASNETYRIAFDEPVYTVALGSNAEFNTETVRYDYTSLVTPESVYDYDMNTRQRELKKRHPVLGGYDPTQYTSERLYAKAADGVEVPISLVYKKGFVRDGNAPALLYGYGAYGLSSDPEFYSERLSLIDRGFVYAIAHIRGGADLGKPWHEDGRILKKKNTFTDFIACAEHLIAQHYSSPKRLSISGGSAGGLLMGAVMNMRPDLFAAVVTRVPFVDALNTELDPTLPLTVGEWEEWGNPAGQPFYDYIKSYAPYENVRAQDYPATLVTAGLNDPRVPYWEPAKWVARLRVMKTDRNILLLKTDMGAGHFGASGRYEHLKETAFNYSFLLRQLGVA
jgi:oligopeptidase B